MGVPGGRQDATRLARVAELRGQLDADAGGSPAHELRRLLSELEPVALAGPDSGAEDYPDAARAYVQAGLTAVPRSILPAGTGHLELCERLCVAAELLGEMQGATAWLHGKVAEATSGRNAARALFDEAAERFPTAPEAPMLHLELAQWDHVAGDERAAFERVRRALRALERPGASESHLYARARCVAAFLLSELQRGLGRLDVAAEEAAEAREWAAAAGDRRMVVDAALQEARALVAAAAWDGLGRLAARARDEGLFDGDPKGEVVMRKLLAIHAAARSRADPAAIPVAVAELEAVLASPHLPTVEARPARLRLAEVLVRAGELERAERTLRELRPDAGSPSDPELAALESRIRRASAPPGEPLPREHLDELLASYGAFLGRWRRAPRPEGGVGFLHYAPQRTLVAEVIERTLLTVEGEAGRRAALRELVRAQELGSLVQSTGGAAADGRDAEQVLAAARALLPGERSGLLVLLPAPDGSRLFVLDADGLSCVPLARSGVLADARREFVAELAAGIGAGPDPPAEPLAAAGERLAELLFPDPLAARVLGWSDATCVGYELLGHTPLELLPLGPGASDRLGCRLPVTVLPSLPLGAWLAERPVAGGETFELETAVLAAPRPSPEVVARFALAELPFGEDLEARLRAPYAPGAARVVRGPEATAERFLSGTPRARVVQVLGHGVVDHARARPSGLALSPPGGDGGLVFAEHLSGATAAPLVVLTACGAGAAPLRRGEDAGAALWGELFARGSRAVIVAPRDLEYGSAIALSEVLHRALAEGASPAEAARAARAALAADPDRAHPAHGWIRVVGLGHVPPLPQRGGGR